MPDSTLRHDESRNARRVERHVAIDTVRQAISLRCAEIVRVCLPYRDLGVMAGKQRRVGDLNPAPVHAIRLPGARCYTVKRSERGVNFDQLPMSWAPGALLVRKRLPELTLGLSVALTPYVHHPNSYSGLRCPVMSRAAHTRQH